MHQFDERQANTILAAMGYAKNTSDVGFPGHNLLMIVAALASDMDDIFNALITQQPFTVRRSNGDLMEVNFHEALDTKITIEESAPVTQQAE